MERFVDLTGMIFERLTVIKRAEDYINPNTGKRIRRWLCKCSCANETTKEVVEYALKSGATKSCGCLQREIVKKYNTYDLSGDYGIGYTVNGEPFYFDLEDYDKIKDYCWFISDEGYVASNDYNNNYKYIKFHKLLFPNSKIIDHINHKRNDNRKCNLRTVTHSQNQMNKGLRSNNTSGVTGVYLNKRDGKWGSYISINKKRIYLGFFNNFDDAVRARKEAEDKYFGEFSYDNSMRDING